MICISGCQQSSQEADSKLEFGSNEDHLIGGKIANSPQHAVVSSGEIVEDFTGSKLECYTNVKECLVRQNISDISEAWVKKVLIRTMKLDGYFT